MANILVTGGAGFIGSHLCKRLVKNEEDRVYSIDDYSMGSVKNEVENVLYEHHGTYDPIEKSFVLSKIKPDIIYHLGEYSRVEQSFKDVDIVLKSNVTGTQMILLYALKHNAKLIYAGSSTKFANEENYIQSPYAWSKAKNTELVKKYGEWFGLNYAITYFYNVYGPGEISEGEYATVIGKYKTLMKKEKELLVTLPGTQKRNFTHIDDIIDGLILVGKSGFGDEYGIGSQDEFSILEITKLFGGNVINLPAKLGNRMSAKVLTKKTEALGWKPKRNLFDYIEKLKQTGWCDE